VRERTTAATLAVVLLAAGAAVLPLAAVSLRRKMDLEDRAAVAEAERIVRGER